MTKMTENTVTFTMDRPTESDTDSTDVNMHRTHQSRSRSPSRHQSTSHRGHGILTAMIIVLTIIIIATLPLPTVFVNNNFDVTIHELFRLHKMVTGSTVNGITRTEFDPHRSLHEMTLTSSAQKIRDVPNAGGNSVASETLSFEMLAKCFGARLVKTEMEVEYFPKGGPITDYVCEMFGHKLGVSVTRAMNYRGDFTTCDARRLLNKKLQGIVQSSKNSLEGWSKQILHVWAQSVGAANSIQTAYKLTPADVRANTVVLVTEAASAVDVFANK